jgi:alpha-tubulin suppressor-like RCC1 family protein
MHGSSTRVLSSLARQLGAARFSSSLAVLTFGVSPVGALGHGATTSVDSPRRMEHQAVDAALRSWKRDEQGLPCVAAGLFHTAVALPGLGAFICGKGAGGRLAQGDEDNADVLTHVQLAQQDGDSSDESTEIHSVALGGLHSVFLTGAGHVYTAGFGGFGALGHGDFKAVLLASLSLIHI